jgi:hypothetical protein
MHSGISVGLMALLLGFGAGAFGQWADNREPARLKAEEFAILPWGPAKGELKDFRTIYDCGFNMAGFVPVDKIGLAARAGLKVIVSDPLTEVNDKAASLDTQEIEKRVGQVVKKVKDHPAVWGYYLRDEPGAPAFAGLGRWADAVRKAAPGKTPYINLFPLYLPDSLYKAWGVGDYEGYVEKFVETVKPTYISYDHYALMDDGSLRDGYFRNLEIVRRVALRHNIPFWNIVLSNAHFHYANPTEGGLRFQAYTTLAYGAKGISYFTYFAPDIGNYRLAPIDQFGNKTATWDYLRSVNMQIHALGPTYLKLKSVNVFHHPNVPEGCQGIDSSRFVKSVGGGDVVVGEFTGPAGKPYVIAVNKDLHKSMALELTPKTAGPITHINQYTGRPRPWEGEDVWLAAGQGVMLELPG